jgi:hypothetical protein
LEALHLLLWRGISVEFRLHGFIITHKGLIMAMTATSMRNGYYTLLIFLWLGGACSATSFVIAVTPTGIVIGADGMVVNTKSGNGTAIKIFLLKDRLIAGSLYTEMAKSDDTGVVLYNFPTWVRQIDKQMGSNASAEDWAGVIEKQIPHAFKILIDGVKSGSITKEKASASGIDSEIVQYVVASYERGSPRVFVVSLDPDWNLRTVNIRKVLVYPDEGQNANPYLHYLGRHLAIDEVTVADSNKQREFAKRVPVEFAIMLKRQTLTLKQASNVIRAFLGIEAKAEPCYVGLPFTVVTIPRTGNGWVRTYKTDISALSTLPKSRSEKINNK